MGSGCALTWKCVGDVCGTFQRSVRLAGGRCLWQDIQWVLGIRGKQAQLRNVPDFLRYWSP